MSMCTSPLLSRRTFVFLMGGLCSLSLCKPARTLCFFMFCCISLAMFCFFLMFQLFLSFCRFWFISRSFVFVFLRILLFYFSFPYVFAGLHY